MTLKSLLPVLAIAVLLPLHPAIPQQLPTDAQAVTISAGRNIVISNRPIATTKMARTIPARRGRIGGEEGVRPEFGSTDEQEACGRRGPESPFDLKGGS